MKKSLLASAAAVALIATTGFAGAQSMDKGGGSAGPSGGASAPPAATSPAPGGAMNRGDTPAKGGSEMRSESAKPDAKSDGMAPTKGAQKEGAQPAQRTQDNARDTTAPAAKQDNARDNTTQDRNKNSAQDANAPKTNSNTAQDNAKGESKTTGQAAAGAKISTEQRTQITTVIKEQNVRPVTNVNFNISVGSRVPRGGDVTFHVLPPRVIAIYPEWRGYEYILVRDEILVIDPRTLEIVAVLPA